MHLFSSDSWFLKQRRYFWITVNCHFAFSQQEYLQRVRAEYPGLPCFIYGHSTGGAVALKVTFALVDWNKMFFSSCNVYDNDCSIELLSVNLHTPVKIILTYLVSGFDIFLFMVDHFVGRIASWSTRVIGGRNYTNIASCASQACASGDRGIEATITFSFINSHKIDNFRIFLAIFTCHLYSSESPSLT